MCCRGVSLRLHCSVANRRLFYRFATPPRVPGTDVPRQTGSPLLAEFAVDCHLECWQQRPPSRHPRRPATTGHRTAVGRGFSIFTTTHPRQSSPSMASNRPRNSILRSTPRTRAWSTHDDGAATCLKTRADGGGGREHARRTWTLAVHPAAPPASKPAWNGSHHPYILD